jgi:hypothetical protein
MDTKGWLTCLETQTGRIYQANDQHQTRDLTPPPSPP